MFGGRRVSGVFAVALLGTAAAGIVVSGALAAPSVGFDISYPQCNASFPASPAFGIVGVNHHPDR
jgi:hypothetical protein